MTVINNQVLSKKESYSAVSSIGVYPGATSAKSGKILLPPGAIPYRVGLIGSTNDGQYAYSYLDGYYLDGSRRRLAEHYKSGANGEKSGNATYYSFTENDLNNLDYLYGYAALSYYEGQVSSSVNVYYRIYEFYWADN